MKKITNNKIIIIIFSIIIILGMYLINQNYLRSKLLNSPLPEVKLKEKIEKAKSFAIMIQGNSENDKYQEYKEKTWPGDDYKFKEAKCVDNNGNEIKEAITYTDGKITLITNKTIYCTLYFDKSIIGKLRENEELANKDNLSKDLQGGMYRYQGTDDVDNWICFGTTENCGTNNDLIDKYMYRIIGVTKDRKLYLLKETFIKEGSTTGFAWNVNHSTSGNGPEVCNNKICPEWEQSTLNRRINGTSNGKTAGNGKYTDGADTDIFVDNDQYDYLKSGDGKNGGSQESVWYSLIDDHNWLYGDLGETTPPNTYKSQLLYEIVIGRTSVNHYVGIDGKNILESYKWSKSTNAKISLMYLHDYYYAYYDGLEESTRGNPGNATNVKNSWIHFQKDGYNSEPTSEWLSVRRGVSLPDDGVDAYVRSFLMTNTGAWSTWTLSNILGVRPVFYLSSKAKIVDGDGTKTSPFIIEI